MDPRVALLREILTLNTRLVRNCLDGVSPAQWMERPCKDAANMAFIAWHLQDARYYLIALLGGRGGNPFKDQLDTVTGIDQAGALPGLVEFRLAWSDADESLAQAMMSVRPEILSKEAGHPFPVADRSALGGMTFLVSHESYHVGQLGLLRRAFGLSPMRYE